MHAIMGGVPEDSDAKVQQIEAEVARLSSLIDRLLSGSLIVSASSRFENHGRAEEGRYSALSRAASVSPTPLSFDRARARMVRNMIRDRRKREQRFSSHLLADPGQVEQVLMNLCINARDAMPEGGRLSIATAAGTLVRKYRYRASVSPLAFRRPLRCAGSRRWRKTGILCASTIPMIDVGFSSRSAMRPARRWMIISTTSAASCHDWRASP